MPHAYLQEHLQEVQEHLHGLKKTLIGYREAAKGYKELLVRISSERWGGPPDMLKGVQGTTSYRGELKTHSRHVKGAHFGPNTFGKYWDLRWFKKVLVVIL